VLLHLALLAFAPARLPFPVMHVDTGHNFPEVIEYRDEFVERVGARLVIASVQQSIDDGRVVEDEGPRASRNRLQSVTLLDAIAEHGFDAAFGGGRRDEDKARAKERILSFRDRSGRWDPRSQRPEPWDVLNARIRKGEHLRAFPLSNWTELDIWRFIETEQIPLPTIYFAHRRVVVERDGMLLGVGGPVEIEPGEQARELTVRYRTVGDASCTGAVLSSADSVEEIIAEVAASRITERGATRADDTFSESAMEDRKREGYF
jgi:sulfate adenylyltransferase subunit 2